MITNLPYLKASFIALAPYLPYTYHKYHIQSIEIDQSSYFTNYKQLLRWIIYPIVCLPLHIEVDTFCGDF